MNILQYVNALGKTWVQENLEELHKKILNAKVTDDFIDEFRHGTYRKHKGNLIHHKLDEHGFINGEPKKNTIKLNPQASFWWQLYLQFICPMYPHHSSSQLHQQMDLEILDKLFIEI